MRVSIHGSWQRQWRVLVAASSWCVLSGLACEGKDDIQRDSPIPPTPQSVNGTTAPLNTAPASASSLHRAAAASEAAPLPGVAFGKEDGSQTRACSAVGMVSAKWLRGDQFELQRRDLAAIVDALREYAKTAQGDQLAPARSSSGKPGLRVLGVGPKAECGLQSDDILLSVNGISVADKATLAKSREQIMAGGDIELMLERAGQQKVITYLVRG